jgi:hypothetical protein
VIAKLEDFICQGYFLAIGYHLQSGYAYRLLKIVFCAWLMHPSYKGALIIYYKTIEPTFKKKEFPFRERTIAALLSMFLSFDELEARIKQALAQQNKTSKQ